jgi:hypothetical protein
VRAIPSMPGSIRWHSSRMRLLTSESFRLGWLMGPSHMHSADNDCTGISDFGRARASQVRGGPAEGLRRLATDTGDGDRQEWDDESRAAEPRRAPIGVAKAPCANRREWGCHDFVAPNFIFTFSDAMG